MGSAASKLRAKTKKLNSKTSTGTTISGPKVISRGFPSDEEQGTNSSKLEASSLYDEINQSLERVDTGKTEAATSSKENAMSLCNETNRPLERVDIGIFKAEQYPKASLLGLPAGM